MMLFPFVLSFASFCALHCFWRARSALPPLARPFPYAQFPLGPPCSFCPGGHLGGGDQDGVGVSHVVCGVVVRDLVGAVKDLHGCTLGRAFADVCRAGGFDER